MDVNSNNESNINKRQQQQSEFDAQSIIWSRADMR